ncbi:MAG: S8 family serine peptidase [Bacteroidales bacterium]|nr:S8 family serine peptidase [Bacteroidales bacterium]
MKKTLIALLLFLPAILFSCAKVTVIPDVIPDDRQTDGKEKESAFKSGRAIVKVTPELALELESNTSEDGTVVFSRVNTLADVVETLNVFSMERLFADAGVFEERSRAEGLHLWYTIVFDDTKPLSLATDILKGHSGVIKVECDPINRLYDGGFQYASAPTKASENNPYNDPLLYLQWHYQNNGSEHGYKTGCDVNVFPVWETCTPIRQDVIVCIVDGGVDYTHEDLEANMWHNPEQEGDAQYGYNFCKNSYEITPDSHATHVAGTIAAVNNNEIGVCGIAGGDYAEGIPGVRIMSCQIFSGDDSVNGASAIKWGADHGAVICQNSWGYPDLNETPESIRAAVDYFTKYAGIDENGEQTGPMAGGLVVFAAGNERKNGSSSEYDRILNVVSVGADFCKAGYSNWGRFADLAAPGGDATKGNKVLSTLPGNKYGWMAGTSMACPHVSGVAALVLSICGGPGFTPQDLRTRLEATSTDISAYNPDYYLGRGLVNAHAAVSYSDQ